LLFVPTMIKELFVKNKLLIFVASGLTAAAGMANTALLGVINKYAASVESLSQSILVYSSILTLMITLNVISQYLLTRLGASSIFDVRKKLAERTSLLSYQQLQDAGVHRLYTALTSDIGSINQLITSIPSVVYNLTVLICCFVYLFYLSPLLGGIVLGAIVFSLVVTKIVFMNKMESKMGLHRQTQDELFKCYEGLVHGFNELRFNQSRKDDFHSNLLEKRSARSKSLSITVDNYMNILTNWNAAVVFVVIGSAIIIPRMLNVDMEGKILPFVLVFFYMIGPIGILSGVIRQISGANVAINKLNSLNIGESKPISDEEARVVAFDSLKVVDLTYSHKNEKGETFTVGPINLNIPRGELVFFVGGNGSGKTTAAKMLCGLYSHFKGQVYLNGKPLDNVESPKFTQLFSTIFSDFYLFDNIKPKSGVPISDEEVRTLIQELDLAEVLSVEKGVFSTTDLSLGQRKRLALLQALIEDSEIYVLDEWAAEQDPESREKFYKVILPKMKARGKTVIVVTHDDRYFSVADKLVKFEYGKMAVIKNSEKTVEDLCLEHV